MDNVIRFPSNASLDVEGVVERIQARVSSLETIVAIIEDKEGDIRVLYSEGFSSKINWLLDVAKLSVLGLFDTTPVEPEDPA